ncbi:FAD-dependent monooxygenase [Streptomyces sp. NPDC046203]|uniref:FAD-dependent monooxygenase n=1 Tax=Streptomyces sp. NPDC046203 TaxID=3154602 RepID=UPI0033EFE8A5
MSTTSPTVTTQAPRTAQATHAPAADGSGFDTDVLVVGAGPTGLLLAGDLAVSGLRVTLVERRTTGISNMTRAFAVHARSLEQLDARGLADRLVATGSRLDRMEMFGKVSLDLSQLRSRFPFVLVTPQYEVERALEERARSAGVDIRIGTELRGLRQDADSVTAELAAHASTGTGTAAPAVEDSTENSTEDGTEPSAIPRTHTLRARYLVGTDGVHSAVRRAIDMPFPGTSVLRSLALADVRLADTPPQTLRLATDGDAFAVVMPFGDGWYRVMGWDRAHQVPDSEPVELDELRTLARRAFGTDYGMHDARWLSRFHSDERQAPSYRVGRVFLAGDAAHVHTPAGGQGMNTGLQDAANLSWKLAAVLHGEAPDPDALLDTYQAERHPVGTQVLRSSGALIRLAIAHTPLQRATRALTTHALGSLRPVATRTIGQVSGIGIGYDRDTRRVPDLKLREGRLYELLRDGRFVLVAPEGTAPTPPPSIPAAPGRLIRATWSNPARRDALLVRPDGYTAPLH